jgi:hypothetical protein
MLNDCSAEQWLVLELCEGSPFDIRQLFADFFHHILAEIGVDTIEIANFEFFSSNFKVLLYIYIHFFSFIILHSLIALKGFPSVGQPIFPDLGLDSLGGVHGGRHAAAAAV